MAKSKKEEVKKEVENQGRVLTITTPNRHVVYTEEDFQKYNIYFELFSDGGDPQDFKIEDGIPKIKDSSWNPGSVQTKKRRQTKIILDDDEYTTKITNPNWKISINIGTSITEGGGFGFHNESRVRTPVNIYIWCYASDGQIMTERSYEKLAWFERHKFGRDIKQTTTVIQPVKQEIKNETNK